MRGGGVASTRDVGRAQHGATAPGGTDQKGRRRRAGAGADRRVPLWLMATAERNPQNLMTGVLLCYALCWKNPF